MWEFDCGVIPVVDDDGRVAGIVTDRDICMAAYTQGKALSAISVASAMARDVAAAHADDGIEQVEELMRDKQVRRLPVLDGESRLIGLVSMNDLARLSAREEGRSGSRARSDACRRVPTAPEARRAGHCCPERPHRYRCLIGVEMAMALPVPRTDRTNSAGLRAPSPCRDCCRTAITTPQDGGTRVNLPERQHQRMSEEPLGNPRSATS